MANVGKYAKSWTKALTEQAQTVQEKLAFKTKPMEEDPLHQQRRELNEFLMLCNALLKVLTKFCNLLDSVSQQCPAVEELQTSMCVCELAVSRDFKRMVDSNGEAWGAVNRQYDTTKGRIQQLQFEVRNKGTSIQQAQKAFEQRDKKNLKMEDNAKKVERARDGGKVDGKTLEKMKEKSEKAAMEFDESTLSVTDHLNHLLSGRQRFLQDTAKAYCEIQVEFFARTSQSLNDNIGRVNPSLTSRISRSSSDMLKMSDFQPDSSLAEIPDHSLVTLT